MFYNLIARLDARFLPLVFEMEDNFSKQGDDFSSYDDEAKRIVASCAGVAVAIKTVLDTPMLTDDGLLTDESEATATNVTRVSMKRESPSEQRQCEGAATSTQKEKDTAAFDGSKAAAGACPAHRTLLGVRNANLVFGAELLADSFHILAQKHLRPIARFPHQHLVALGALPHLVLRAAYASA